MMSCGGAALDQRGTLWLETVDGKRARITADGVSHSIVPKSTREVTVGVTYDKSLLMHVAPRLQRSFEFVSSGRIVSVIPWHFYEDRQGNIWIGTQEAGLYRLQKQLIRSYTKEQGLIDRDTYATYQDRSGVMWIGAWHSGLSRFEDGRFTNYTMADGLPNELVTSLFEDREKHFWVGTHGGLSMFDHGRFRIPSGPTLPYDAVVQTICEDRRGTLWFGTRAGVGRYEHGVTQFFYQERRTGGRRHPCHRRGSQWRFMDGWVRRPDADSPRGGYALDGEDGLPSSNIWSIYEDSDGALWIGTYEGGLGALQGWEVHQLFGKGRSV